MSAPQGSGKHRPPQERIIAEVLNNAAYVANASIFGAAIVPVVPDGQSINWNLHFAFDGQQAVLEMSLDGGTTWAILFEDITPSLGATAIATVTNADQVQFRFSKAGTIIYARVGQPI